MQYSSSFINKLVQGCQSISEVTSLCQHSKALPWAAVTAVEALAQNFPAAAATASEELTRESR